MHLETISKANVVKMAEQIIASTFLAMTFDLSRVEREGQNFLHRNITGDETWVFSFEQRVCFDPELKRQSAQWLDPGEPKLEKARRKQGAKKVMHIVFFDVKVKGTVLSWPVPVGVTVQW